MNDAQKVAIVTGGSQGIGEGIVTAYLDLGYAVVATSRTITQNGSRNLVSVAGDISNPHTASEVVNTAIERFGRIDTLVNNVGIFVSKPFIDYTEEDVDKLISTNLLSFFRMTQKTATHMLRQGSGHIVSISTVLVEQPMTVLSGVLPIMTKGGINAASRALAMEYATSGIRVNVVAPGVIKTPMNPVEYHGVLAVMHPMQRMGEIREIVDAVLYLERASFVTGEIMNVDGGAHAGRW
jgi:NAD(P)-dependent dehydrogenase (short-subunit alcohol dehydrogenase family)